MSTVIFLSYYKTVGTVEGPEWDRIIIDGTEYIKAYRAPKELDPYSIADKGKHLGIIKSGDRTLHVYAVKGEEDGDYIYVRWEWEGEFYIREDMISE